MLSASFYPYAGGAERQALELSKFLQRAGVKVRVLTRRIAGLPDKEIIQGISVFRLWSPGRNLLNSIAFMFSSFVYLAVHRMEYGIIHVHLASSPLLVACLIGQLYGKKVFVKPGRGRGLGEVALSRKTLQGRIKLKLLSLWKPKLLTLSTDIVAELREANIRGIPVIPFRNGVDTEVFIPVSRAEKRIIRNRLGIHDCRLFIFVGRLVPEKHVSEFLKVWAECVSASGQKDRTGLLIVGEGCEELNLKTLSCRLGVNDIVFFAGGKSDPVPYYQAADIFVLPSVSEGLSNAMLEAMSCGLAVLASRVGAAGDLVTDGENGFLFAPADENALREYINMFLAENNSAESMGARSRQKVVGSYSMQRVVEELVVIYKN